MANPFLDALHTSESGGVVAVSDMAGMFGGFSDADLMLADELIREERHRRALEAEDLGAVADHMFDTGFGSKGFPAAPFVTDGGLLVCAGAVIARSKMAHKCAFVHIDDTWVWDHGDVVLDDVRQVGDNGGSMRSVTLLVARERMKVDFVFCKLAGGKHVRDKVQSYTVEAGKLVVERSRTTAPIPGQGR